LKTTIGIAELWKHKQRDLEDPEKQVENCLFYWSAESLTFASLSKHIVMQLETLQYQKKKKSLFADLRIALSSILGQDQNIECFFYSEKRSLFAWVMTAHFFPYGGELFIGWCWQFKDHVWLILFTASVEQGYVR
jgi:hypothetical protein